MSTQGLDAHNLTGAALGGNQPPVALHLSDLEAAERALVNYEITRIHNLISSALMRDLLTRFGKTGEKR